MQQITRSCVALPCVLLAAIAPLAAADTLYVPDPWPTIQIAVIVANDGDEVVVGPGVYTEQVVLEGKAITLRSLPGPKTVTIDGQGLGAAIYVNGFTTAGSLVDGFTITGSGDGVSDGGLVLQSTGTTVRNCRFVDNPGSGMYIDHSAPTVTDCEFVNNTGGGLVNIGDNGSTIARCTFTGNERDYGGAIINVEGEPEIISCTFRGNRAILGTGYWSGNGGAIFNQGFTLARITNCLFVDNIAERAGGAIYNEVIDWPEGTPIANCTFVANEAPPGAGAAVHTEFGEVSTSLHNCILWDNGPDVIVDVDSAATTVSTSAIEGGWSGPGRGNIDVDPAFVDPANGDYRVQPGSLTIDAGDNTALPNDAADLDGDGDTAEIVPHDLDGNARRLDDTGTPDTGIGTPPIVDMGAYEFQGTSCRADLDQDGTVGFREVLSILANWGACAGCPEDLDGDGFVGFVDLVFVLAHWGPCPER